MACPSSSSSRATLTGLPAELRLLIWSYTIATSSSVCHIRRRSSGRTQAGDEREKKKSPSTTSRSVWSILHIDQATRNEILPLFFPAVEIHLHEDLTEPDVRKWMDVVGETAIRDVKVVRMEAKRICAGSGRRADDAARRSRWAGEEAQGGTTTSYCTRTSFYHASMRTSQLLDMQKTTTSSSQPASRTTTTLPQAYKPAMFYMFAHELCSHGAAACMRRTMAAITESGAEEWYLREGEMLSKERLLRWWKAVNGDYYCLP